MNPMFAALTAMLIVGSTLVADDKRIGTVDFYGYSGLDLNELRSALLFREGEVMPSREQLDAAREPYAKAIGRSRVEFTRLCCLPDGRWNLFVGIEEPDAPPIVLNRQPAGDIRLPLEIVKIYQDLDREIGNAARHGLSGEDDSHGYRLSEYPPSRTLELKLRAYARAHTSGLINVLENCADDTHRAAAAEALGYANESSGQIAVLVHASFDRNVDVRNNAIRALGVLVRYDPKAVTQIPMKGYVALLHSIDFHDRNKTALLMELFTRTRDPNVLRTLRSEALTPLREIAQWKSFGHALCAVQSLARIAGFEERYVDELTGPEDVGPILQALH